MDSTGKPNLYARDARQRHFELITQLTRSMLKIALPDQCLLKLKEWCRDKLILDSDDFVVNHDEGYSFIINIIPIFVLGTMFINKFNMRIYVAYSVFYTLGSVMAMLITFVNFQVIRSSEHLASHCVFFVMNAYVLINYVKKNL